MKEAAARTLATQRALLLAAENCVWAMKDGQEQLEKDIARLVAQLTSARLGGILDDEIALLGRQQEEVRKIKGQLSYIAIYIYKVRTGNRFREEDDDNDGDR